MDARSLSQHGAVRTLLVVLLLWAAAVAAAGLGLRVRDAPAGDGALVTEVAAGSSAQRAGLQPGDLILAAQGRALHGAADLVDLVRDAQSGGRLDLRISRDGWQRSLSLDPETGQQDGRGARTGAGAGKAGASATPGDARRARVAVGGFQVKAAKANQQIGDGLREMLLTSLFESGRFVVVERMDLQGIAAEQTLSRSGPAGHPNAMPEGQMEVADILIYGIVSEFEPEAGGFGFSNFIPQAGLSVRQSTKFSEMAIDVRAVDVRSGRVLVAQRIPGSAQSYSTGVGGRIAVGALAMPVGLSAYRDTPMEMAIRDCIQKAVYYIVNNVPQYYFRHP